MSIIRKIPWRLSSTRKYRQRQRLKLVDHNIDSVDKAGLQFSGLSVLNNTLPKENEMTPRDKYFTFNKNSPTYRKGVHKVPKWTRITQRNNPAGF